MTTNLPAVEAITAPDAIQRVLADLAVAQMAAPSIVVDGKPYLVNQERSDNRWGRSKTVSDIRTAAAYKWLAAKREAQDAMVKMYWVDWLPFTRYVVVAEPRYPNHGGHPDTGSCFPSVKAIVDGARDSGMVVEDRAVNVRAHIEMPVVVVPHIPVPHVRVWLVPLPKDPA